ncbi:hypothetical protein AWB79_05781 [Caballeronia hypogeia]|uniref:Uncharacterized protein n=1 Tax=Caballeronia hypogeia TaxID=1777140 RepID=A0A158CQH4_9BURK|nr:hypothetical protein [Caballeronia hypogeia]SAK84501.1 hypothetical protein AWB79_05781 [Caballeronia hypogeia]
MNYLTIIAAVWAICAICAVFFIRGATQRKPVHVQSERERNADRSKHYGRTY